MQSASENVEYIYIYIVSWLFGSSSNCSLTCSLGCVCIDFWVHGRLRVKLPGAGKPGSEAESTSMPDFQNG